MASGSHYIIPLRVYVNVLATLLVLTVLTVVVAQFDFGALNFLVAFGIATLKAGLVAAYFMQLKYDEPLYTWILLSSVFFLLVFWGFAALDVFTRIFQTSTL